MPYWDKTSLKAAFQQGLQNGIRSLQGPSLSTHEESEGDSIPKSHPHDLIHRAWYA